MKTKIFITLAVSLSLVVVLVFTIINTTSAEKKLFRKNVAALAAYIPTVEDKKCQWHWSPRSDGGFNCTKGGNQGCMPEGWCDSSL